MTEFMSTKQVAKRLGIPVGRLERCLFDGRFEPPPKSPSGNFLWTQDDLLRAAWQLLGHGLKDELPATRVACE